MIRIAITGPESTGKSTLAMQLVEGEVYDIPTSEIDFDRFELPSDGPWDLAVCNHMLTHAVRPKEMLTLLRAHLAPGGHAYFYNEPDDAEILVAGKSMFTTLNAFHLQTFDDAAFVHALAASGFEPVFLTHHEGNIVCLARAVDAPAAWPRMTATQLSARRDAYLRARDRALLMLPESRTSGPRR